MLPDRMVGVNCFVLFVFLSVVTFNIRYNF